jgi:hypothetical protein
MQSALSRLVVRLTVTTIMMLSFAVVGLTEPISVAARITAQETTWESVLQAESAGRIFTPASGALFVQMPNRLVRSDDAGATWMDVPLPSEVDARATAETRGIVDPIDHAIIYSGGAGGVHRSTDAGASWI